MVKVRVPKPNSNFTGESMGIAFQNGEAEVKNKWLIQRFKESGYLVGDDKQVEDKEEKETKENKVDYFDKDGNIDRLKGFNRLEELGVEFKKNISNDDLVELLKEHDQ